MTLQPGTDITVASEIYSGPATVHQVYPDCVAIFAEGTRGRTYVVKHRECTPVVRDPTALRNPVKRDPCAQFVVGLAGPKKVGKSSTTVAIRAALAAMQLNSTGRAFADPLYQMVSILTGIPVATLKDQSVKDRALTTTETANPCLIGKTPREILEFYGEGTRTFIGIDHWVHRAFTDLPIHHVVVFEDARHGPEFEACDMNIELSREGCKYPCNHPSAMPPEPKYIHTKLNLDSLPREDVGAVLAREIVRVMVERQVGSTWPL